MGIRAFDGVRDSLWRRVAAAPHRLLLLDYDGTLAPFTPAREEARPLPRSMNLLARIAAEARTAVGIVSGRPVPELEALARAPFALLVGEHGWEEREPEGALVRHALPPEVERVLDEAERLARASGWGGNLERKRAAVVLHTRAIEPARARALEEHWLPALRELAPAESFSVDRIDGGVELRARGRDKGAVVRERLAHAPAGTLAVFVGDDVTDEDAFAAVREQGFGVRVGPAGRPTMALARVPSVEAVADFLEEWLAVTGSAAAPARRTGS